MNVLTALLIIAKKLEIIQMPISGRIKHSDLHSYMDYNSKKENGLLVQKTTWVIFEKERCLVKKKKSYSKRLHMA